ncbi:hypothetical protein GTA08_BOTSDO04377 [Botryosphaeria dothidea]|uniref:Uncharacterized protein n=1 Tax=Botryosphaeria dothidea TaxID=55169 RepID=A0A8H4IW99_9PEZI|nr:hypothetical protein GTA08_BOTSDO04377 [Botryosphaeria dothidea]
MVSSRLAAAAAASDAATNNSTPPPPSSSTSAEESKAITLPVWGLVVPPEAQQWEEAGFRVRFSLLGLGEPSALMTTRSGLVEFVPSTASSEPSRPIIPAPPGLYEVEKWGPLDAYISREPAPSSSMVLDGSSHFGSLSSASDDRSDSTVTGDGAGVSTSLNPAAAAWSPPRPGLAPPSSSAPPRLAPPAFTLPSPGLPTQHSSFAQDHQRVSPHRTNYAGTLQQSQPSWLSHKPVLHPKMLLDDYKPSFNLSVLDVPGTVALEYPHYSSQSPLVVLIHGHIQIRERTTPRQ